MLAEARPPVNNFYIIYKLYRNYRNSAARFFNPRAEAEEHVQLPLGQAGPAGEPLEVSGDLGRKVLIPFAGVSQRLQGFRDAPEEPLALTVVGQRQRLLPGSAAAQLIGHDHDALGQVQRR